MMAEPPMWRGVGMTTTATDAQSYAQGGQAAWQHGLAGTLGGIAAAVGPGEANSYQFGFTGWQEGRGYVPRGYVPIETKPAPAPSEPGKPISEAAARPARKIRIVEE